MPLAPKVDLSCANFIQVSLRVAEQYFLPAVRSVDIYDQFAFRPTATTPQRPHLLHRVTLFLERNDYGRCLVVDFDLILLIFPYLLRNCRYGLFRILQLTG